MTEKRKKRPRIKVSVESEVSSEYVFNAASKNAKKQKVFEETLKLEIWTDKHYLNRTLFEDETGKKRDGIQFSEIEHLLEKSLHYLIYFSSTIDKMSFINIPPPKTRKKRIVLKELKNDSEDLNVVLEFNFIDDKHYELTVITAMLTDNFKLSDNQYTLELNDSGASLYLFRNKSNDKIADI